MHTKHLLVLLGHSECRSQYTKPGSLWALQSYEQFFVHILFVGLSMTDPCSRFFHLVQVPLKQEVELDRCVAMQMNDRTNTVGVQRGVWVVGMVEDACVKVREHLSGHMFGCSWLCSWLCTCCVLVVYLL